MSEVKAQSYSLRTETGGWLGQVVLTNDGFFGSVTDYGNFSFKWSSTGIPFKEFLLSLDNHYFYKKMAQGLSYVAHDQRTDKACIRFAEEILPPLKKALLEEIEIEKLRNK